MSKGSPFAYKGYKLVHLSDDNLGQYTQFLNKKIKEANPDEDELSPEDLLFVVKKYSVKENVALLAYKDGEIVGHVLASDILKDGYARLNNLDVVKEHRGKDLGRGLLITIETLAKNARSKNISLHIEQHNHDVIGFYKKLGYTVNRREVDEGWQATKRLDGFTLLDRRR